MRYKSFRWLVVGVFISTVGASLGHAVLKPADQEELRAVLQDPQDRWTRLVTLWNKYQSGPHQAEIRRQLLGSVHRIAAGRTAQRIAATRLLEGDGDLGYAPTPEANSSRDLRPATPSPVIPSVPAAASGGAAASSSNQGEPDWSIMAPEYRGERFGGGYHPYYDPKAAAAAMTSTQEPNYSPEMTREEMSLAMQAGGLAQQHWTPAIMNALAKHYSGEPRTQMKAVKALFESQDPKSHALGATLARNMCREPHDSRNVAACEILLSSDDHSEHEYTIDALRAISTHQATSRPNKVKALELLKRFNKSADQSFS